MIFRNSGVTTLFFVMVLTAPAAVRAQTIPVKTDVSYAQLLADRVLYEHGDIQSVTIFARKADGEALSAIGYAGQGGASVVPTSDRPATQRLPDGSLAASLPLENDAGAAIGVLTIVFAKTYSAPAEILVAESALVRDALKQVVPKRDTLFDPYVKGADRTDTLAQRINQTLLARHPDVNVIAIHLTAPGDAKNKVWGINRPNFLGRDSDEVDTDTEKTGKIVMQVIPASHRMEVHMPLLSPSGDVIGTLCTVYFWKTASEAADYYGRSLGIMNEARLLTPADRSDLFKP